MTLENNIPNAPVSVSLLLLPSVYGRRTICNIHRYHGNYQGRSETTILFTVE